MVICGNYAAYKGDVAKLFHFVLGPGLRAMVGLHLVLAVVRMTDLKLPFR